MDLVAFFSGKELMSAGLLEGEPTKGPLLKTIELLRPERILLLAREGSAEDVKTLAVLLPVYVRMETLLWSNGAGESMSTLLAFLKAHREELAAYRDAAILNAGTPQERATLWILKHDGTFVGTMVEPPSDYSFLPAVPQYFGRAAEKKETFVEEASENAERLEEPWVSVAAKIGCVGRSPRFRQMLEEAAALANHPTPILLFGETGTGKEVVARFVHMLSSRSAKPLVCVNCAALPETLAESILFGHEKGSFTGAYKRQVGKFEQAHEGTLFLDELGELSLANQAKLLRALETRCVDPLGSNQPVEVDVRVIAATNRNLLQAVAQGRFREDLYYRLRAGEIDIPSLRERASDIPLIALHLLERFNATLAIPKQFSRQALKFLEAQPWPGNVRDLINTIERAALLCPRNIIEPEDFRVQTESLRAGALGNSLPALYPGFSVEGYLQKIRRDLFEKALAQAGGSRGEAARLLGITPQAIHKYLKQQEQENLMQEKNPQ